MSREFYIVEAECPLRPWTSCPIEERSWRGPFGSRREAEDWAQYHASYPYIVKTLGVLA